jgi:hypothetical protein
MRTKPSARAMRGNSPEEMRRYIDRICRIVAIVVAALSTYSLFFKILFL